MKLTKAKATVLAALFVLMQLVAPPGMMVSGGEDGFEIVICTAQGMQTVLLDEHGNEIQQAEEQEATTIARSAMLLPRHSALPLTQSSTLLPFLLMWLRFRQVLHLRKRPCALLRPEHLPSKHKLVCPGLF
ncbi:hypothetical protein [Pseudovibrio denitrificans]|uniref:hypothetical protein n=1 Tax=Pseudovibrio denitrificans TaxID=258256 RepID=UPI000AF76EE7|nr:hypothetical protein [Pseudovibrio denitrificans]